MYKIVKYAERISSESPEIKEKYEIIKSLSQDFTIENEIALKLDKEISSRLGKVKQKIIEIDIPEIAIQYIRENSRKFSGNITSSAPAANFLRELIGLEQITLYEQFVALYLNRANKIIGYCKHSKGGISGTVVDVRLILITAIKALASGIIICHNHPSGGLVPSEQDRQITEKIKVAAKNLDISILDHIIVTKEAYYSFSDEGLLGIDGSDLSGTYKQQEVEQADYVDENKLKAYIKKAKKLKL